MVKFLLSIQLSLFILLQANAQSNLVLDNDFAQNGWDTIQLRTNQYFKVKKLFITNEGKLLVCGSYNTVFESFCPMMFRYNSDGTIDESFGDDGFIKVWDLISGTPNLETNDFLQRPDGKIVFACFSNNTGRTSIYQLLENGQLDVNFGDNGIITFDDGEYSMMSSINLQEDGKLVCFFDRNVFNNGREYQLIRYNSDGSVDNTFGNEGTVSFSFPDVQDYYNNNSYNVFIDSDGFISIVFIHLEDFVSTPYVMRFTPSGDVDTAFGDTGQIVLPFEEAFWYLNFSTVMSNDNIYLAAFSSIYNEEEDEYYSAVRIYTIESNGNYSSVALTHPLLIGDFSIENLHLSMFLNQYYLSFSNEMGSFILVANEDGTLDNSINGSGIILVPGIPDKWMRGNHPLAFDNEQRIYFGTSYEEYDDMEFFNYTCRFKSQPVGVSSNKHSHLAVYPNPTQGLVFIEGLVGPASIAIYDLQGRLIERRENFTENSLQLKQTKSGVYFMQIQNKEGVFTQKIIIQ